MYELSNELTNDLRLRVLENQEISIKSLKSLELMASPQQAPQKPDFDDCTGISSLRYSKETPILLNFVIYFVHDCRLHFNTYFLIVLTFFLIFKGCFNKHDCNFDYLSKTYYSGSS